MQKILKIYKISIEENRKLMILRATIQNDQFVYFYVSFHP